MSIFRLLIDEIWHRKVTSFFVVFVVVVAVVCLSGSVLFLQAFDRETETIVEKSEEDVQKTSKELEDDYRKLTKELGYNLLILPATQKYEDWLRDDFGKATMPEDTVTRLGNTPLITINHLLPALQTRIDWPEEKRNIVLVGIRGQVPIADRKKRKPIMAKIPAANVMLGHELARVLDLKVGDKLTFHGKEYTLHEIYPQQGDKNDISMWIDLKTAQELTDKPGQINVIYALQCHCEDEEQMKRIDREIRKVLGDEVQIKDYGGTSLARTKMRIRAHKEAQQQVAQVKATRQDLRQQREKMMSILLPIILVGAALWLASLALFNVRQRRSEIGILRAVGVSSGRILTLFLGKAALLGVVGAGLGCGIAFAIATNQGIPLERMRTLLLAIVIGTPLVAILASWVPSLLAIRMDPALALREE